MLRLAVGYLLNIEHYYTLQHFKWSLDIHATSVFGINIRSSTVNCWNIGYVTAILMLDFSSISIVGFVLSLMNVIDRYKSMD